MQDAGQRSELYPAAAAHLIPAADQAVQGKCGVQLQQVAPQIRRVAALRGAGFHACSSKQQQSGPGMLVSVSQKGGVEAQCSRPTL